MKWHASCLALIAALSLAAPATAQEHLNPPGERRSELADYEANVRLVLRGAFEPDVRLRVIVKPSFQPEHAIGLRERDGAFTVFSMAPKRMVWSYSLAALMRSGGIQGMNMDGTPIDMRQEARKILRGMPANPGDLPVSGCVAPVDAALAETLVTSWRRMLQSVEPNERLGLDGVTYVFSMPSSTGELVGEIWSPEEGSRTGDLVSLAGAMRAYCLKPDPETLGTLKAQAQRFAAQ
jgi:hypothetical protein